MIQKIDRIKECLSIKRIENSDSLLDRSMLQFDANGYGLVLKEIASRQDVKLLLDEIYENEFLKNNFSFKYVQKVTLGDVFDVIKGDKTEYITFKSLFNMVSLEFLVVQPICGIKISSIIEIGDYTFFFSYADLNKKLNAIRNNAISIDLAVLFPDIQFPCIGVTVFAIDSEKAMEKATEKLQEFENIVQFMVGMRSDEFYVRIVAPDILHMIKCVCVSKESCSGHLGWSGPLCGDNICNINDVFFVNLENKKIWELFKKTNKSDWEKKLIRSINWVGRSLRNPDINMAFLQMLFSLESLLVTEQKDFLTESITAKLADSVAYVLANDLAKRIKIAKQMKVFYSLRSKIVHFGSENISSLDLNKLFVTCKGVIISFFRIKELEGIKRSEDLGEWFIQKKYS
jgi:hypothetical protein